MTLHRLREMVVAVQAPGARRASITAFALYLAISWAYFGAPTLTGLSSGLIADGASFRGVADATAMMWFLVWWPHAIFSGLNPFLTDLVWAPHGVNLAWTTSIPAVSLILSPVTYALGPAAAYNLASLSAPAVSAWTAYILCRHITKSFWPSLIGGYLYGFSSFEAYHLPGHLNLSSAFITPLLAFLILLRLDGTIRPRTFVFLEGLALVVQYLIFNEVFATTTVFGLAAMLIALLVYPGEDRKRLLSVTSLIAGAYAVALLILSPCLYFSLALGFPSTPIADPLVHSTDLLNFVLPTGLTFFGARQFAEISGHFLGESSAYLGLPLVLIVLIFAFQMWHKPLGKFLIITLSVICLATLGAKLHIAGISTISLPWELTLHLPLINHAMPSRFSQYIFLVTAIVASIWLSSTESRGLTKALLMPLSLFFLFPNVPVSYSNSASFWKAKLNTPPFFASGLYKSYLCPGEISVILPYGDRGESMYWQAQSHMYFRMAGGYVSASIPVEDWNSPAVQSFYSERVTSPDDLAHIREYLLANRVRTIIVAPGTKGSWRENFSKLGLPSKTVGGVDLYQVSNQPCSP